MTITGEPFPRCALPGCTNPTDTQGHPCGQCRRDFGTFLRHNPDAQPMTADAQTARDQPIRTAYRTQDHAHLEAADRLRAVETGEQPKPGQTCWLCEQRRLCVLVAGQWECRDCRQITG